MEKTMNQNMAGSEYVDLCIYIYVYVYIFLSIIYLYILVYTGKNDVVEIIEMGHKMVKMWLFDAPTKKWWYLCKRQKEVFNHWMEGVQT